MTGPSPLWYATRATGVVALVLLTATVVLGVAGVARFATPRWPRVISAGLHRNLPLLAVAFVAAHVLTTVLDTYAPIGWVAAVVPFSSSYRTFWLGLGALASDLLLAVTVTSLLRARLGYRAWRAVHWLGYACWPVALWHGLGAGTDSKLPWLLALDAACVAAVTGALGWRMSLGRGRPNPLTAALICAIMPAATALFVLAGPLQPGWARRAGTPARLLAGTASAAVRPAPAVPADGSFLGRAARMARPGGHVTIVVTAQTSTAVPQHLVITLRGRPDGTGVRLSSGTVRLGPAGTAASYQGPVVRLDDHRMVAELHGPRGSTAQATVTLAIRGTVATGRLAVGSAGTP
jgi:sulfoxide reductase heme-binding subunit YedZ